MLEDARDATVRTYGEMRDRGFPDYHAYKTALAAFRHRHPDIANDDAKFVVADWISESLGQ
jgi:hypothetical protein